MKKVLWFIFCFVFGFFVTQACSAEIPPECWAHAFKFGEGSYGSCFHIGNGLIVTNAHVIGKPDALIIVHFRNGETVWGKLKAMNESIDLALVEVTPPKKLGVAILAISEAKPGDEVYYIGNPFPLEFAEVHGWVVGMYNGGIISTAVSSGGASGSPLYNKQGLVVGVISQRSGDMPMSKSIPLSVLAEFIKKETHGKDDLPGVGSDEAVKGRRNASE